MSQEEIQIPKGWIMEKLSNVIEIHSGFAFRSEDYSKTGIFVLRTLNIGLDGKINKTTPVFLSNSLLSKYSKYELKKNDVLMVMVGATIGKIGIVQEEILPALLNQNMWLFKSQKIEPRFLFYMLKNLISKYFPNFQGSGMKFFHIGDFKEMYLPIPPISTQKKIVQKLDNIFMKLEEKKKQIFKLNDSKTLISFLESNKFFTLQSIRTGFLANGNWKSYPKVRLDKITKITSGSTPNRQNLEYWNGDIPWFKSGELLDGDIRDSEEHITKEGLSSISAKIFPKDTILVALYGQGKTRGKTGRLLVEASTNQAICAIFPHHDFLSRYIQYWIRSLYWELRKTAFGGAQPNWNTSTIKELEITLPPLDEQKNIIKKLDEKLLDLNNMEKMIKKIIEQKKKNLNYVDHLQSSILDSAFSGKLVN